MSWILVAFAAILSIFIIILFSSFIFRLAEFANLCHKNNFTTRQTFNLFILIQKSFSVNPVRDSFTVKKSLDSILESVNKKRDLAKKYSDSWAMWDIILTKLYTIRHELDLKIELNRRISGTRDIVIGTDINLSCVQHGLYNFCAKVIDNINTGILISYPSGGSLPNGFSWRNARILADFPINGNVYRFLLDSDKSYFDAEFKTLKLLHSDNYKVEQKRKNIRHNVHIPAVLVFSSIDETSLEKYKNIDISIFQNLCENEVPLRCVIKDISLGGLQILIGGEAIPHMGVNLEIKTGTNNIHVSGYIQSTSYYSENDYSYIRIRYVNLDTKLMQDISSLIFGIGMSDEQANSMIRDIDDSRLYDEEQLADDFLTELEETGASENKAEAAPQSLGKALNAEPAIPVPDAPDRPRTDNADSIESLLMPLFEKE